MATTPRLGRWQPHTADERLDRIESLAMINQLAVRYALSLDSRNMDALVDLFVADVRVGKTETGRAALHRWYSVAMREPKTSVHLVANHIVDFDDADHAHGIVYCHDELERPEQGNWETGKLQYWDTYVRVDGEWYFQRRKFHRWYLTDPRVGPQVGGGVNDGSDPLRAGVLPDSFPTWAPFWAASAAE